MATRKIITLTLACLLAGCAHTSADIVVGPVLTDDGFYPGHGIAANIRIKRHITERTWCEYSHTSYIFKGQPFGPANEEDSLNQLGCGIHFGE